MGLLAACAAPPLTEDDLRPGLTRAQVEAVLGEAIYALGEAEPDGAVAETHYYVSETTDRLYEFVFKNGVATDFQWQSMVARHPAAPGPSSRGALAVGQSKARVQALVGAPNHVSGGGGETVWWYFVSADEIYLVLFRDDRLTAISATSLDALRSHRRQMEVY